MAYCKGCFEKQLRIDELVEENRRLKAQLRYRERKEKEGYFGASTTSSRRPFKETTAEENREKKGGAIPGCAGHGRPAHTEKTADRIIERDVGDVCPDCGGPLVEKGARNRTVIEAFLARPEKLLYRLHHKICKNCRKKWRAKAPSVLPKSLYGNEITAQIAVMHYIHGIPMGRVTEMTGVPLGSLIDVFHRLARYLAPAMATLKEAYRRSCVKHADETGWRNDGQNGYAWLFCTTSLSIFLFKNTRAASVPKSVFGQEPLPGVLVVDRYNAYNKAPVALQYCYAHLLRDAEKLEKDCPDDGEVLRFSGALIPLLAKAMHLGSQDLLRRGVLPGGSRAQGKDHGGLPQSRPSLCRQGSPGYLHDP